jgi:hypothetical protein
MYLEAQHAVPTSIVHPNPGKQLRHEALDLSSQFATPLVD